MTIVMPVCIACNQMGSACNLVLSDVLVGLDICQHLDNILVPLLAPICTEVEKAGSIEDLTLAASSGRADKVLQGSNGEWTPQIDDTDVSFPL